MIIAINLDLYILTLAYHNLQKFVTDGVWSSIFFAPDLNWPSETGHQLPLTNDPRATDLSLFLWWVH